MQISFFKHTDFHIIEHFNQSKLTISGHFSSLSSFMLILVLVENVVAYFVHYLAMVV